MRNRHCLISLLTCAISLALFACSNHETNKPSSNKIIAANSADSIISPKSKLTKIYTQAIAEFIKAANKKDNIIFDSLYFGKHVYNQPDDFPDIVLPHSIGHTQIKLVTPEAGLTLQRERRSLVYVNMVGWIEKDKAEFIFVVFSNGGEHQYDYSLTFNYHTAQKEFELAAIYFENYLHSNNIKPDRIVVYKNGKYILNSK